MKDIISVREETPVNCILIMQRSFPISSYKITKNMQIWNRCSSNFFQYSTYSFLGSLQIK